MKKYPFFRFFFLCILAVPSGLAAQGQEEVIKRESAFYEIKNVPIPEHVKLEVGGLAFTDNDKLGVTTRRGELWLINKPYSQQPKYSLFASGLHEPLWLAYRNGSFYTTQRSELTKITDSDGDDLADTYHVVYSWPLSGNYHEYSYGPLFLPDGDMVVTLNLGWEGRGKSLTKWRGWMLKISEDGRMEPYATGLRSPAGFGVNSEGDIFYAENQGDWIGSGFITHLEKGDFSGNPAGLRWAGEPNSPVKLRQDIFHDSLGTMFEFAKTVHQLKIPSVWFPHTIMGISTSAILEIDHDGFGPFKGQLLVGDQGHSKIMRVFMEKVNGVYQGACFPFREGFSSGILRMAWGSDHSLFVGMTSRGWASTGPEEYGLQRLVYNGQTPFEMKAIRVIPDGFEIEYTEAVDKATAEDPASYETTGFTYSYHRKYGSPIIQQQNCPVRKAEVSADGRKVRLLLEGLREGFVHQLKAPGVRSRKGMPLLHNEAYYSLNSLPAGSSEHEHPMLAEEGDRRSQEGSCGADPSKNVTTQPADWTNGPDVEIKMGTRPGLKFELDEFEVPAGSRVKLTFSNDDDMLHNLVITNPGAADEVGKTALNMGLDGPRLGYVPASEDVLFNTCILEPGTSESIYFVAPEKPEDYTYVCTFPGHYVNMRGTMRVVDAATASR